MSSLVHPGSVVVGVDGSTGGDAAVVWAARYAAAHRRPLRLVHGAGALVVSDFGYDLEEARESLLLAGRSVIEHARDRALTESPSLHVTTRLEAGEPRSLLVAETADAHLLVLGSRGHGAVLSLLLGSVGVALVAHAVCPVVVVRPAAEEGAARPVVVGVDGAQDSSEALTFAFELADDQHRPLEVVHAAGESWMFPIPDAAPAVDVTADWDLLLAELVAGYAEKFPEVAFSSRVAPGSAAAVLVAASRHASTVVVGARGRGALARRLLGSVSRSVLEQAGCTVAVVRNVQT
jgi:nucleotide-binding universal stress UspA family protein